MLSTISAQAPSWQELYLSVTQDRVGRGAAPAVQPSGVTRRVLPVSAGGAAGPGSSLGGDAEAASAKAAAAAAATAVNATDAAVRCAAVVADDAPAAAALDGLAALVCSAEEQPVAPPPASAGRKRNRKALAPRRCAILAVVKVLINVSQTLHSSYALCCSLTGNAVSMGGVAVPSAEAVAPSFQPRQCFRVWERMKCHGASKSVLHDHHVSVPLVGAGPTLATGRSPTLRTSDTGRGRGRDRDQVCAHSLSEDGRTDMHSALAPS